MFWTGLAPSGSELRRAFHKWGTTVLVVSGLVVGAGVQARTPDQPDRVGTVALSELPLQARATHQLILAGGPFPYSKDGTVFGNRERLLPPRSRGHYREYTVRTPGAPNRGARRIVCGGRPVTQPEACFFTDDHYSSFRRIAP